MNESQDLLTGAVAHQNNGHGDHLGGPALNSLNPMRRAFVIAYVLGADDIRGVAYKSYLAAGYTARNNNVASAASYQVLQDPLVKEAILELNHAIDLQAKSRLKSWSVLAEKAQTLLDKYLDTLSGTPPPSGPTLLSANAITVIKEVLDRGVGKVAQPVEHDIGSRLDTLIKQLASKRSTTQLKPPTTDAVVTDNPHSVVGNIVPPVLDAEIVEE